MKLYSKGALSYPGFSTIVKDHLKDGPEDIMLQDQINGDASIRNIVSDVIEEQYRDIGVELDGRIEKLRDIDSKTVTTGHQLQLCGGPAFLHYKTITTIRLARELEKKTGRKVVPIFWLASEDHDFKEVSWVYGESKKFVWSNDLEKSKLPVGKFLLEGLEEVVKGWGKDGVDVLEADAVLAELVKAKARGEKYVHLFRRWLEVWYGDTELLVLDASHPKLKGLASGVFANEFNGNGIAGAVRETTEELNQNGFNVGTHIREVNLFFQKDNGERVGIVRSEEGFVAGDKVINSGGDEWGNWCKENAEHLSPGVLLRPIYQELLLNNSHVVLGPGELGYWKQLEGAFKLRKVVMPVLHLRDHVLVLDDEVISKAEEIGWSIEAGWWNEEEWKRIYVESKMPHSISDLENKLIEYKKQLVEVAIDVDRTLEGTASASGAAMDKALGNLLKKIRKAVRRKNESFLNDLGTSARKVYFKNNPQDRFMNFHVLSKEVGGFLALRDLLLADECSSNEGVSERMFIVSNK